ncbi:MAG: TIGR02281 family clan AA aspartic protease [Kiritimatiellia bacterium]
MSGWLWFVCFATGAGSQAVVADTIRLKNGRTLEGIVSKETPHEVVIDLGVGSATIPRSSIAQIEYSEEPERAKTREEWQSRYSLYSRYVPPQLQGLINSLRSVEAQREAAIRAERAARREEKVVRSIHASVAADEKHLSALSVVVQRANPTQDPASYNELIHKINALRAGLIVRQQELEQAEERRRKSLETVSEYMRQLFALENQFRDALAQAERDGTDVQSKNCLARVDERIREIRKDLRETAQPVRQEGGAAIVTAIVNDVERGNFILDTGAGVVSLSEDFAKRAGIDLNGAPERELVMADGRHVRARAVVLRSVKVGEAMVEQVPAVVMPMGTRISADGLLGMSFLENFSVNLDPATGKVTFRQFNPK